MKRHIAIIILGFITLQTFAQYTISGKIASYNGDILLLVPTTPEKCDTLKHITSTNGDFFFKGKIEQPMMAKISFTKIPLTIPIFLEEQSYEINGDTQNYRILGGGKLQQLRNEFQEKELKLIHERDSIQAEYEKEYGKEDIFGKLQIRGLHDNYEDLYNQIEDEFIRNNDNLVSACLIAERYKTLSRKKLLAAKYALLGENARNTIQGKWLKPYAEKIARIVPGGTAPNLKMQTPDGNSLSIYDIKGKVKVIDFWASWCGPCRAENPNVKRIYEKYKDKGLEIISISLDNKKEAWIKAINDDKLPWKHISDLKGWNSIVTDVYEIHAVPYLFVLDENNRIIAEGLRGEALEKCIADALNIK